MKTLIETVKAVLDSASVNYFIDGEYICFSISEEDCKFNAIVDADEEEGVLECRVCLPQEADTDIKECMLYLINMINNNTRVGKLVIDPEDGEITFRLCDIVDDGAYNFDTVRSAIVTSVSSAIKCNKCLNTAIEIGEFCASFDIDD